MSPRLVRVLLVSGLMLPGVETAGGPPEAAPPPRQLDLHGDPLPDGAVARLGSVRLRHHGPITTFVLLPDGKTAVTGGADRTVRTWDLASGNLLRQVRLADDPDGGWKLALAPDARTVAAFGPEGNRVDLYDAATGRKVKTYKSSLDAVWQVYFSPDGEAMAFGKLAAHFEVVDRATGKVRDLGTPVRSNGPVYAPLLRFTPDGKRVVAGGGERHALCVFDRSDGRVVFRLDDPAVGGAVSADGARLATCGKASTGPGWALLVFDLGTGKRVAEVPLPDGALPPISFAPDGKKVACGSDPGGCVVDLTAGRVGFELPAPAAGPTFTRDGSAVVSIDGARLRVWDAATGRERHPYGGGGFDYTCALGVSQDGRHLAVARRYTDRGVGVWDLTDGRQVRWLSAEPPAGTDSMWTVQAVGFSADGRVVRAGVAGGQVRSWELATGKERPVLRLPVDGERAWVSFPPGGRRAYTLAWAVEPRAAGQVHRLTVWDPATGAAVARHKVPLKGSEQVFMGWAAGELTATLTVGQEVWACDLAGGGSHPLAGLARYDPNSAHDGLAVSPDGRLVAGPAVGGGVGVWEAVTGKRVLAVSGKKPSHLAVAPASRALVAAGPDGLAVFDLATGAVRFRRPLPPAPVAKWPAVRGLVCTDDGRRAVTALPDGTALVWDLTALPPEPLADKAGEKAIADWWADLAGEDAARAHRAGWHLSDAPAGVVVPFLRERLRPAGPDSAVVQRLVRDLDSNSFAVREAATRELRAMGPAVLPALRTALAGTTSAEVRQRLEGLITRLTPPPGLTPQSLQALRGVGVLDRVGTADAQKLLEDLAHGPESAPETKEAKVARERLGRRQ